MRLSLWFVTWEDYYEEKKFKVFLLEADAQILKDNLHNKESFKIKKYYFTTNYELVDFINSIAFDFNWG